MKKVIFWLRSCSLRNLLRSAIKNLRIWFRSRSLWDLFRLLLAAILFFYAVSFSEETIDQDDRFLFGLYIVVGIFFCGFMGHCHSKFSWTTHVLDIVNMIFTVYVFSHISYDETYFIWSIPLVLVYAIISCITKKGNIYGTAPFALVLMIFTFVIGCHQIEKVSDHNLLCALRNRPDLYRETPYEKAMNDWKELKKRRPDISNPYQGIPVDPPAFSFVDATAPGFEINPWNFPFAQRQLRRIQEFLDSEE